MSTINMDEDLLRQIVREEIQVLLPVTEKYLSAKEAAEYLNYTLQSLYQLTCKGTVPHQKVNGHLLFKEAELSEYIKKGGSNA